MGNKELLQAAWGNLMIIEGYIEENNIERAKALAAIMVAFLSEAGEKKLVTQANALLSLLEKEDIKEAKDVAKSLENDLVQLVPQY